VIQSPEKKGEMSLQAEERKVKGSRRTWGVQNVPKRKWWGGKKKEPFDVEKQL